MNYFKCLMFLLVGTTLLITSCKDDDESCIETTWYEDSDGDGLGNPDVSQSACEQPTGYVADNTDTNDSCVETTWYEDSDGDGLGNPDVSQSACEQPTGYVADNTDADDTCVETTWYEDSDGDGLGNPDVSQSACEQPTDYVADNTDPDDTSSGSGEGSTPLSAFDEFNSDAVTISFDGDDITIVSNALPNHTTPYWNSENDLYIDPVVANVPQMSPGAINEGSYTVTVPASPEIASTTSQTGLGAIGISVTGVPIFNGQEGPNIDLSENVASGFDYAGGHMGPTGYHYHLESADVDANTTLSFDDEKLIGILSDGFLLYGRKDFDGSYPSDLDESGGHFGPTEHSNGESFYHYHIINEFFIGSYILLFGAELQGTPNNIM